MSRNRHGIQRMAKNHIENWTKNCEIFEIHCCKKIILRKKIIIRNPT